jgi:hypothetical protein
MKFDSRQTLYVKQKGQEGVLFFTSHSRYNHILLFLSFFLPTMRPPSSSHGSTHHPSDQGAGL